MSTAKGAVRLHLRARVISLDLDSPDMTERQDLPSVMPEDCLDPILLLSAYVFDNFTRRIESWPEGEHQLSFTVVVNPIIEDLFDRRD
jgi:hypothetical protein